MNATKTCEYCGKEISEYNGTLTCSPECLEEMWVRRFSSYPRRTDLTLPELFEFLVSSLLIVWDQGSKAQYAEEVFAASANLMHIRRTANHPCNQTSWGAVLREAGRRRFGQ